MAIEVTYEWYRDEYGGQGSAEAFAESLPAATRHVRFLTGGATPPEENADATAAYKRAVCAALDVLAEWGEGSVNGFQVGDFSVKTFESQGRSGLELATCAALEELAGTGLAFGGVA